MTIKSFLFFINFIGLNTLYLIAQNPEMKRVPLGDYATMEISKNFTEMDDDQIAFKYPAQRRPIVMFTDSFQEIDISFSIHPTLFVEKDMKLMMRFLKSTLIQQFEKIIFYTDTVISFQNKTMGCYTFKTERRQRSVTGEIILIEKYVSQRYLIAKNEMLIFSFYCPFDKKQEWEGKAKKMMESILLKVE